jgi:hypothetical protein
VSSIETPLNRLWAEYWHYFILVLVIAVWRAVLMPRSFAAISVVGSVDRTIARIEWKPDAKV